MNNSSISLLISVLSVFGMQSAYSLTLPENFGCQTLLTNLEKPLSLAFLPDGRMLILQMYGTILIAEGPNYDTAVAYMTMTNVSSSKNTGTYVERGLLDFAIDPDFSSNGYFYVFYSAQNPHFFRISRFKHEEAQGSLTSFGDTSSEAVLWQDNEDYTSTFYHYGGSLQFGPDGKLYCTLGDKFRGYMDPFRGARAQDTSRYAGKVIRINKDGSIPDGSDGYPANPFINGPGLDAIWALGLRNPFRARWDFPSGRFFIGEVGSNDEHPSVWEDLHICKADSTYAGVNYGWPNCEGPPPFSYFPNCNIGGTIAEPLYSYEHSYGQGCIIGGVVYRDSTFPSTPYYGAYFYGDFMLKTLNYLTFDSIGNVISNNNFATGLNQLVAIEQGTDGFLYLVHHSGEVSRIIYPAEPVVISGTIRTETGSAIPSATISLTSAIDTQMVATHTDGIFGFQTFAGNDCSITPSKNNDSIINNGISTQDIILMRRQILGTQQLGSYYKMIAADVNNSQTVTSQDIILTRAVILQVHNTFPNGKLWEFVNSDFMFTDSLHPFPFENSRVYECIPTSLNDQDFIGIKLGDVDNSYDHTIAKVAAVGELIMSMEEYKVMVGDEITIPLKAKDFKDVTGYQFTLSWDANVLSLEEVTNKSIEGFYGEHRTGEGLLTTSWNTETGNGITLDDEAILFEMRFKVTGEAGSYSPIRIGSELTVSEAYNQDLDLLNITPTNGILKVEGVNDNYDLQILPNPFYSKTNIKFFIPHDEIVTLIIYDLLGKQVKMLKTAWDAGEHIIEWVGDDDTGKKLAKGLYQVRMTAGSYSAGKKVVMIQ